VKLRLSTAFYRVGILHLVAWVRRRLQGERAYVLSFHCVSDPGSSEGRYFRPGMTIDADQFEEVVTLAKRHHRVLPLGRIVDELRGSDSPSRPAVAITFDDGYRCVHRNALPALRRTGTPATVFLPTDYIDSGRLLWWDEVDELVRTAGEPAAAALSECTRLSADAVRARLADEAGRRALANDAVDVLKYASEPEREAAIEALRAAVGPRPPAERRTITWEMAREMRDAGVDFQCHGAAHRYLDGLVESAVEADLARAGKRIEQELGHRPRFLAYPDGRHDARVRETAKRLGYLAAVTTARGGNRRGTDLFELRRIELSADLRGRDGRVSYPLLWAELLGVWNLLFLRRARTPQAFSTFRPRIPLEER